MFDATVLDTQPNYAAWPPANRRPAFGVWSRRRSCWTSCRRPASGWRRPRPEEIIAWGVEHYAPYLTMATAFGPEGCVILAMLAKIAPETYVFNLETGYQFQETLDLRDRIAEKYGIEVDLLQPELSVAEYEALHGGPLYRTNPNQCCFDRKIKTLQRASEVMHAWMSGIRRDQSAGSRPGGDRRLGQEVRPGEDQPAGELDEEGRLEADHGRRHSVQSAARSRLPEHRLLAVHAGRGRGRDRRTGRPLERHEEDRVRPAFDQRTGRQRNLRRGVSRAEESGSKTSCSLLSAPDSQLLTLP